jgi:hypothetical protein
MMEREGKHTEDGIARRLVREDLLDIRSGIKAGRYINEATGSQGIVQRLLNALGCAEGGQVPLGAFGRVRSVR